MTPDTPARQPQLIYWKDAKPSDFMDAHLGDWIQYVGDISTEYELRFIRNFGGFWSSHTHTSPPAPVCDAKVCRSVINAHREEAATEAAKAARERALDEVREALSHIRYQEEDMWFIEAAIKKIESLRAQQEQP